MREIQISRNTNFGELKIFSAYFLLPNGYIPGQMLQ